MKDEEWREHDKRQLAWAKNLKVGDVVCDCRYKHLAIKELRPLKQPHPGAVRLADWLTIWMGEESDLGFKLFLLMRNIAWTLRIRKICDVDLVLEDGAHCSAMSCCTPITECEHPDGF